MILLCINHPQLHRPTSNFLSAWTAVAASPFAHVRLEALLEAPIAWWWQVQAVELSLRLPNIPRNVGWPGKQITKNMEKRHETYQIYEVQHGKTLCSKGTWRVYVNRFQGQSAGHHSFSAYVGFFSEMGKKTTTSTNFGKIMRKMGRYHSIPINCHILWNDHPDLPAKNVLTFGGPWRAHGWLMNAHSVEPQSCCSYVSFLMNTQLRYDYYGLSWTPDEFAIWAIWLFWFILYLLFHLGDTHLQNLQLFFAQVYQGLDIQPSWKFLRIDNLPQ